jgi:hypothetical protein
MKKLLLTVWILAFTVLAAPSVLADANDGIYSGSISSADCGSGTLLINMADGLLTGSASIAGTTYALTGGPAHGTQLDFYTTDQSYFFVGTIGNGSIAGTYMTKSGSACSGVSFSATRVSTPSPPVESADIISYKQFDAIQELSARKEVTNRIVDEVFMAPEPRPSAGDKEANPSVTAAADFQFFNLPVSYAYSEALKLGASISLAYADKALYIGNLSGRATYYYGDLWEQLVLTTVAVDLPTGDRKIGAGGLNVQASQTRVMDRDSARVMFAYSYRYTSEVNSLDTGNTANFAAGLDHPFHIMPFLGCDRAYAIATAQQVDETTFKGNGLDDGKILVDLTGGLIWQKWNLRAGISLPVLTFSNQIHNGDRLISVDVGYRWGL